MTVGLNLFEKDLVHNDLADLLLVQEDLAYDGLVGLLADGDGLMAVQGF